MEENSVQLKKQPQPQHEAKLVSLPEEQQIKAMMRLWERMTQLWGHRHQSAWGQSVDANGNLTDTAELWLQGLGRFTLSEIGNGVNKMVEKGQEWPPTLPEFTRSSRRLGLCSTRGKPHETNTDLGVFDFGIRGAGDCVPACRMLISPQSAHG
jgi:hypothetical protein